MNKIDFRKKLELFDQYSVPKIVDEVNVQYVKVAKAKGSMGPCAPVWWLPARIASLPSHLFTDAYAPKREATFEDPLHSWEAQTPRLISKPGKTTI